MREDAREAVLDQDHHRAEVAELIAAVIRAQHPTYDTLVAPERRQSIDRRRDELERRRPPSG